MPKQEPERRCIVTREALPKAELIRFALSPDNKVVADVHGKLPGRGCWVRANKTLVQEAITKNHFARAFKQSVPKPEGMVEQIEQQLRQGLLNRLGMARAAGHLLLGWDKASSSLKSGKHAVYVWVLAADASERTTSDVTNLCRAEEIPLCKLFDAESLSQALGREHAVHAAFTHEGMAQKWLEELARLTQYEAIA